MHVSVRRKLLTVEVAEEDYVDYDSDYEGKGRLAVEVDPYSGKECVSDIHVSKL